MVSRNIQHLHSTAAIIHFFIDMSKIRGAETGGKGCVYENRHTEVGSSEGGILGPKAEGRQMENAAPHCHLPNRSEHGHDSFPW